MAAIAFLIGLVLVCILAARYGADSAPVERGHHRTWL
jgi:hypothetical protein